MLLHSCVGPGGELNASHSGLPTVRSICLSNRTSQLGTSAQVPQSSCARLFRRSTVQIVLGFRIRRNCCDPDADRDMVAQKLHDVMRRISKVVLNLINTYRIDPINKAGQPGWPACVFLCLVRLGAALLEILKVLGIRLEPTRYCSLV